YYQPLMIRTSHHTHAVFFFHPPATPEIYTLSLHDALPISSAMLLRYSLQMEEAAQTIEKAVEAALAAGHRTGDIARPGEKTIGRSEEHTSELQSQSNLVCRLLLEKKKKKK